MQWMPQGDEYDQLPTGEVQVLGDAVDYVTIASNPRGPHLSVGGFFSMSFGGVEYAWEGSVGPRAWGGRTGDRGRRRYSRRGRRLCLLTVACPRG